jgi:chemotaxis protein methyltransferase CheR
MQKNDIEKIEVDLLLEGIYRRFGYDFRHYAKASITRRVRKLLQKSGCREISEMIPRLLHDASFVENILHDFSIPVTEMFRDPKFFRTIREIIVPYLKTCPFIKVWHAGCATGEEVYSLAILLTEEGLYERTIIFATDFNNEALKKAKEGIYSVEQVKKFTENYQQAGGLYSFSEYYHADYGSIIVNQSLKENITFANHNLVVDNVFSESHLILCRNVLIYFDRTLQDRVLSLFAESLMPNGFLCLGSKESLLFSEVISKFKVIDEREKVYQKIL